VGETTYVLATATGRVRLAIADTDVTDAIFDDDEVQEFLRQVDNNEDLAAARALRAMAAGFRDRMEQMGHYTDDQRGVTDAMLRLAREYEDRAQDSPDNPTLDFQVATVAWSPFVRRDMLIQEVLEPGS